MAPTRFKRVCKCGKHFSARPADIARGWGRFCSKACAKKGGDRHWSRTMNYGNLPPDVHAIYYAWDAIVRSEEQK